MMGKQGMKQATEAALLNANYVAQQLSDTVLSLPMHTELTKEEQNIVINSIKNFFN